MTVVGWLSVWLSVSLSFNPPRPSFIITMLGVVYGHYSLAGCGIETVPIRSRNGWVQHPTGAQISRKRRKALSAFSAPVPVRKAPAALHAVKSRGRGASRQKARTPCLCPTQEVSCSTFCAWGTRKGAKSPMARHAVKGRCRGQFRSRWVSYQQRTKNALVHHRSWYGPRGFTSSTPV